MPSDVFTQHRMTVCDGQYKIGLRSFIHKGARLYQAYVMEDNRINYQINGTRSEVFVSLRGLFRLYATAQEATS